MKTDAPAPVTTPPMASYQMHRYHQNNDKRRPMLLWAGSGVGLVLVGALALSYWGNQHWDKATANQLMSMQQAVPLSSPAYPAHFDATELANVPPVVRQYLTQVLKDNQPVVRSVRLEQVGTFNRDPAHTMWDTFSATQWVTTERPGFVWDATMPMYLGIAIRVRDAYVAGVGIFQPAVMGIFKLAGSEGTGNIAQAQLMRYLAESVWYPTALLPSQGVQWTAIDAHAAQAVLTDGPISVTLRFDFNAAGYVERISSTERAAMVGNALVPMAWETRLSNYQQRDGMQVPVEAEAAWLPTAGTRQPYWRGSVTTLAYDMPR